MTHPNSEIPQNIYRSDQDTYQVPRRALSEEEQAGAEVARQSKKGRILHALRRIAVTAGIAEEKPARALSTDEQLVKDRWVSLVEHRAVASNPRTEAEIERDEIVDKYGNAHGATTERLLKLTQPKIDELAQRVADGTHPENL